MEVDRDGHVDKLSICASILGVAGEKQRVQEDWVKLLAEILSIT